jgi:hypothetical protein
MPRLVTASDRPGRAARSVAISTSHLLQIEGASELLPPEHRTNFIRSVANKLADLGTEVSNRDVDQVIEWVLSAYGIARRTHHTFYDSKPRPSRRR